MMYVTLDAETLYAPVRNGEPLFYRFEEDFVEDGIRCIPMIVRFKLDIAGIKLKLAEWSRFTEAEKHRLSMLPCITVPEIDSFRDTVNELTFKRSGHLPAPLGTDNIPPWYPGLPVNHALKEKAAEFNQQITMDDWMKLNNLQRFALLKLCRPGHENRNFPLAMKEFNLMRN